MKKLVLFLFLIVSGLSFAGENNYLFFQSAQQAKIVKVKDNNYVLTLKKSDDYVSYFADRPMRRAGTITLTRFLSMWSNKAIANNFAENPPNAAIVVVTKSGERKNAVGVISNPVIHHNKIIYDVKVIDNQALPEGNLKHVVLFFDDITWNPGGF